MSDLDIKSFTERDLPDISNFVTNHIFKPGQVIFYEGHMPYGIFFLVDGIVELELDGKSKKVEAGAVLGINSFLNSSLYSCTAKAITVCNTNFLSKSAYMNLNNSNYNIANWFELHLCN